MKVQPVASPHAVTPANTNLEYQAQARAKAIAKLAGQQPVPLENPQNISVEELGAVRVPAQRQSASNEVAATTPQSPAAESTVSTSDTSQSQSEATEQTPQQKAEAARWAKLLKQEKSARIRAQQQATKEKELTDRETALANKPAPAQEVDLSQYVPRSRIKEAAWDVLTEEGIDYNELTQQALQQAPKNPRYESELSKMQAKIQALEKTIEEGSKSAQQQQNEAYKTAVSQIRADVTSEVKRDPVKYEAVAKTKSINDVVDLIERTWNEERRMMSVEEALDETENYLVEELSGTASRIDKIKKRLSANGTSTTPNSTQKPNNTQQPQPMKTLTNSVSSTRQLSAVERAKLAFEGKLRS